MSKANPFTQEQLRILENNVYTHHVTKDRIKLNPIKANLCILRKSYPYRGHNGFKKWMVRE